MFKYQILNCNTKGLENDAHTIFKDKFLQFLGYFADKRIEIKYDIVLEKKNI